MLLMPLLAWKKERVGVAARLRRSKGMALLAREGEEEVADRIVPSFLLGRAGVVCELSCFVCGVGEREVFRRVSQEKVPAVSRKQ
jgi:hypothetical protein